MQLLSITVEHNGKPRIYSPVTNWQETLQLAINKYDSYGRYILNMTVKDINGVKDYKPEQLEVIK